MREAREALDRGALRGFAGSADLGGLPLQHGGSTRHRRVIRSDVPAHLSPLDRRAALDVGFVTVVDLRSVEETRARPHPLSCVSGYRSLPLIDPAAEAARDPCDEPTVGDVYAASLTRNAIPIAAIFTALARASAAPVMVCCTAGRDRTGMVSALLLDLAGVHRTAIAEDYAAVPGADRDDRDDRGGPRPTPDRAGGAAPTRRGRDDILNMLCHVDATWGSTAHYLSAIDLSGADIAALRLRLLPP